MEEIRSKLLVFLGALEEQQQRLSKKETVVNQRVADLKKQEEELAVRVAQMTAQETDLVSREATLTKQIEIDRDRKIQLDLREKELDADKERIKKYLNI